MTKIKLAFEEYGEPKNPPLIILHGFFASSRNWRQIAKKFATNYQVFVVDMRNHGLSPHHPQMDYPTMVDDLLEFLDSQNLSTANILGHSMGGKIAMWLALNHPNKVKNLVVADISPIDYQHSFNHTIDALKSIPLEQISNRKQADDFLARTIPESSYRLFLLQNLQLIDGKYSWRINLDIFYNTANNIVGFPAMQSRPQFEGKVLFIMGGASKYTHKEVIYSHFPHAEISVLANANHWLHVDQPDKFLTTVTHFLKGN